VQREEIDISDVSIEIVTATAASIRKSRSSSNKINKSKSQAQQRLQKLIHVPSKDERSIIYEETAKAIAIKESQALPPHGGRPWKLIVTISDEKGALGIASSLKGDVVKQQKQPKIQKQNTKKNKVKRKAPPLFRWYRGKLELACLPHILDKIEEFDANRGLLHSVKDEYNVASNLMKDDEKATDLALRQITLLSTVAWNDENHATPIIDRKWISPDHVSFKSRTKTIEHCAMLDDRDRMVDKVLHGIGLRGASIRPSKPTRKQALEAGYYRFLRDGLWVIGQEEEWIKNRIDELNEQEEEEEEQYQQQIQQERIKVAKKESQEHEVDCTANDLKKSITVENGTKENQDENELNRKEEEAEEQNNKQRHLQQITTEEKKENDENSMDCNEDDLTKPVSVENGTKENQDEKLKYEKGTSEKDAGQVVEKEASYEPQQSPCDKMKKENVKCSNDTEEKKMDGNVATNSSGDCTQMTKEDSNAKIMKDEKKEEIVVETNIAPRKRKRQHHFERSKHWRLTKEQISLCYNAVMEHYEKVSYTVKARALHSELADGFDVFRERGRGRYDMQLPVFDTAEFSFLTDLEKAAWMPVVKKILGDDATIVHKGAFLSMPGAATQVYHQDGPHITTKYQRACHAINIFIPLIDLQMKNGPTEFCIGSHMLGYDYYAKDMCDTPLAPAGSPVIFDYRLGHRGLGNSSRKPRPIVYLTYTSASKEFRDSVNFSRKRYRKLGDLIEKPLSREERALKRSREID
jgi:hypothetical protein